MQTITYKNVHNQFKLNGFHLDREDLCRVAYSFIKEGQEYEQSVGDFLLDWFDNKSYMDMNSSGTTGVPKLIRVEKQAMLNSAIATGDFFGLEPGNKVLNCLPTEYISGKMMFIRAFILGLDMKFVAPSSHPLDYIDEEFDFCAMVPLQAKNSLKKLKNIKTLIVGGAKVHKALEQELSKLRIKVYETFSMTETITHIAAKRIGENAFTVLPNVSVAVDERQCLVIDAKNISDTLIITNDIVNLLSDKQFVWIGRIDNIINSGGIKLSPEKIEEKLSTLIPRRYFVHGVPDIILGEKLVLYIEGEPIEIEDAVFSVLDKYEKPKDIVFIPKFKQTATGKIKRKESLV